jgi:hypothetical protein
MASRKKAARKLANELIMVCLVMVGLLLIWNASQRIVNFNEHQQELAEHSVRSAASEVGLFIKGYQRAVDIFAEENRVFLSTLELWPQDMESYLLLQEKIARYFPEHLTFTLADSNGTTLLEGFEGLIGQHCREDIQIFAANEGEYSINRHQSPEGDYSHFDIMSYWQGSEPDESVFFISFKMDRLGNILENTRVPGHQLMLVRQEKPGYIDATTKSNRGNLPADAQLDDDAQRRISFSLPVPGTHWNLVILPDNTLYSQAHRSILMQVMLMFIGFLVVCFIMRMILLDEED